MYVLLVLVVLLQLVKLHCLVDLYLIPEDAGDPALRLDFGGHGPRELPPQPFQLGVVRKPQPFQLGDVGKGHRRRRLETIDGPPSAWFIECFVRFRLSYLVQPMDIGIALAPTLPF